LSPYLSEYIAAVERTEALGLQVPPRILVKKDCIDIQRTLPVLLDYFEEHTPQELIGQTAAIDVALIPRLLEATGVPFQLTFGWIVREGRPIFQHGAATLRHFMTQKLAAWQREGVPFHIWLTSPACEILDLTFAMNLEWASTREECAQRVIHRSLHEFQADPVYHPTIVGEDFFRQTGLLIDIAGSGR
jgi:hypothetical protein